MNNIDIKEFVNKISNTFSTNIVEKKYNIYIDNSGISLFLFFHALLTNKVTKYDNAFKMLEQTIMRYRQSKVTPPSVAKMGWLLINRLNINSRWGKRNPSILAAWKHKI